MQTGSAARLHRLVGRYHSCAVILQQKKHFGTRTDAGSLNQRIKHRRVESLFCRSVLQARRHKHHKCLFRPFFGLMGGVKNTRRTSIHHRKVSIYLGMGLYPLLSVTDPITVVQASQPLVNGGIRVNAVLPKKMCYTHHFKSLASLVTLPSSESATYDYRYRIGYEIRRTRVDREI